MDIPRVLICRVSRPAPLPDGGFAVETEQNKMRTVPSILLVTLVALLGVVLCLLGIAALLPYFGSFDWSVTPLGRLILSALLALFMVSSGVAVAVVSRIGLTTLAVVLALIVAPLLVSLLDLGTSSLALASFATLVAGILCLEVGSLIGGVRRKTDEAALSGVLLSITLILLAGSLALAALLGWPVRSGFVSITPILHVDSPYGAWSANGEETDEGALGGEVRISVHRHLLGIIEQKRIVYWAEWGTRPSIEWADSRTVVIDGQTIDVYNDPPVNTNR